MVQYNHLRVLQNIKKLFPPGDPNRQIAEDLDKLLEDEKQVENLHNNKIYQVAIGELKADIFKKLNHLVKKDPELKAMITMHRRFMNKERADQLVRSYLEQYLSEEELESYGGESLDEMS